MALFGATGFIGRGVLADLLADGHTVCALVRDPSRLPPRNGLRVIAGDALDPEAVDHTVEGSEAVVSALGTRRGEKVEVDFLAYATRNIVQAMRSHDIHRLVTISGAGITVPGEHKPFPHVGVLARRAVESKQREYEVLAGSDVDWTAARPVRVLDVPAGGRVRASTSAKGLGMQVPRDDLARFMVDQLTDRTYVRQAPFVTGGGGDSKEARRVGS